MFRIFEDESDVSFTVTKPKSRLSSGHMLREVFRFFPLSVYVVLCGQFPENLYRLHLILAISRVSQKCWHLSLVQKRAPWEVNGFGFNGVFISLHRSGMPGPLSPQLEGPLGSSPENHLCVAYSLFLSVRVQLLGSVGGKHNLILALFL